MTCLSDLLVELLYEWFMGGSRGQVDGAQFAYMGRRRIDRQRIEDDLMWGQG